jgi:hypothetical protein
MKKTFSIALILGAVMVSAFKCEEEPDLKDEFVTEFSPVTSTELPATGKVNQEINFIVNHQGGGCSQYSGNNTVTDGKDISVSFQTARLKNAVCTYDLKIFETPYTFTPTSVGEYTFRFKVSEDEDLIQRIVISE